MTTRILSTTLASK